MSMTAATNAQAAASRANEPSMEEILSSIRKIIAEDQRALDTKAEDGVDDAVLTVAPAMNDDSDEDVFDLAPALQIAPPVPEPAPLPVAPAPVLPPRAQPAPQPAAQAPLLSEQTAQTSSAAFQSLTNAVFAQNARTMDDLVKEMLRPMLKSWLDENLPSMVERLVRAEIERVARGGR